MWRLARRVFQVKSPVAWVALVLWTLTFLLIINPDTRTKVDKVESSDTLCKCDKSEPNMTLETRRKFIQHDSVVVQKSSTLLKNSSSIVMNLKTHAPKEVTKETTIPGRPEGHAKNAEDHVDNAEGHSENAEGQEKDESDNDRLKILEQGKDDTETSPKQDGAEEDKAPEQPANIEEAPGNTDDFLSQYDSLLEHLAESIVRKKQFAQRTGNAEDDQREVMHMLRGKLDNKVQQEEARAAQLKGKRAWEERMVRRGKQRETEAQKDAKLLAQVRHDYRWVGHAPVVPLEDARKVWLLSYQRSGSSFTGDIFEADTNSTYFIYEPLDAVYSAMYGVPHGWTVPSDIFTHPNGTERKIPQEEIQAVSMTMDAIFTCNMSSLPTSILVHPFWHSFHRGASILYKTCLGPEVHRRMREYIRIFQVCGPRFMSSSTSLNMTELQKRSRETMRQMMRSRQFRPKYGMDTDKCKDTFYNHGKWTINENIVQDKLSTYSRLLTRYRIFLREVERKVSECAGSTFDKLCSRSKTRVVKTVRALAEHAEPSLRRFPDLKVVHLLRDPRAVANSRIGATWATGLSERRTHPSVAAGYCRVVSRDLDKFQSLKDISIASKVLRLTYGALVKDPVGIATKMFKFIGSPMSESQLNWLQTHVKTTSKEKWRKNISLGDRKRIKEECKSLFNIYSSEWLDYDHDQVEVNPVKGEGQQGHPGARGVHMADLRARAGKGEARHGPQPPAPGRLPPPRHPYHRVPDKPKPDIAQETRDYPDVQDKPQVL